MDKVEVAKMFEPKGHPHGSNFDQRQKMLWLRLEIVFKDLGIELVDYTNDNKERDDALDLLLKCRNKALDSIKGDQSANRPEARSTGGSSLLVADGYSGLNRIVPGAKQKTEVKNEPQKEINVHEAKKASGKKRGRPAKEASQE